MKDEIVPSYHSKKLYDAAVSAKFKQRYICKDGDHNMTWRTGGEEYNQAMLEFFEKCEK